MPRAPKPYWHERDKCWVSYSAGEYLPSGRRKGVRNYEVGAPHGREGPANRAEADLWLAGLIAAEAEGERRASDPLLEDLIVAYLDYAERRASGRCGRWRATPSGSTASRPSATAASAMASSSRPG